MKPILFDASESVFTSNGLGRLSDCISCFVEEERNGKYELEMEYPVGGDHFAEILHSRFIFAVPADGKEPQPFRIYAITKPIGGVCTIYAEHISYQLFHIPLNPFLPEASITRAFQAIKANAAEDCPFEFSTDKTTVANFKVDEPKSIREVLYGSEGSILDVYGGGEYEWDKYNVILHQHRGTDRGVVLRYGKDITDLTQEENIEDTITGIYPFWKGQNDEQEDVLVTLPEKVVHSANAGNFPYKRTVTLDCSSEFETAPTVTQLRTYATNYISQNNIGVPDVSITVSFAPLWQTEEYKDIANLERVNLCDTVTVHYEKLGVDATAKVIRTKYDVLNERYEEIELGSAKSSVASVIRGDIQSAIETAAKRSTEIENKLHVEITENTRKITGGLGGHVVLKLNADGEPEEILIMDTDDVTTAVNVWRFNMGGLGHSHSGYNGPFDDIALTMDGHINANMITVGTLNANLIKAGVLSDSKGINFIDMETGEMRIGASASLGGSTIAQHKAAAVSDANGYTDAQLADYKDTVDAVVSNLQSQIDGQVMTWYYDYEPTMNNIPASDWTTTALRQQHEGDVFYWKTKGYAYRFMKSGSTWGWTLVQDTDITAAIAKAENAQDTADHKRRVFVTQPVPPYDIGDLWTQGSSGDLYRCETARASGSYVAGDWKKATKYTDDSTFTAFRDGTYATFVTSTNSGIQSAQNTANSRITTYYQASQPTAKATGDLWIDTDDGNKLYRWNGSQWKSVQDSAIQTALTNAADAQSTADSKIVTFAQASQPTATDTGDLWIDTDDQNKMYRWSGSSWVRVTDNSGLKAFQNGTYATFVTNTNTALNKKVTTFYQTGQPTASTTGDLWIDTDDGNKLYRWNGSSWKSVQDTAIQSALTAAGDAQSTADKKIVTFAQASQPTATDTGDLWIDTDDSNKMYRWNGSAWKHVTDNSGLKAFQDGTYATFVTSTNTALGSKITTYYQASTPSSANKGDLWIDTDDGNKLHRYSGSAWVAVQDTGIQTAITAAGDAQATADSKIITFAQASQPTATDVGDLWIDTDANNKMYRWSGTQWVAYTDTSALQTWINGAYASTIQTIQGQIDGKAETYHQSADPSDNWTSSEYTAHTGDLWYDTSDGTTYYWNGAVWVSQNVPDEVFDAIDGKAQIFVSQPTTPYNVGDLWFNSATSDIMTCINARASGSYTASDWQKRNKYTDDTAVTTLNTALNQTEIFNRLTNNGSIQGIYMQNGQLYINASYIQSGTLKLGGVNNTNGVLQVFDANGNVIGSWDKDGLAASGNFQIVDGSYKTLFDTVKYPQSRQVEGDWVWRTAKGYATKYDNSGKDVAAKYFIPRSDGGYREVAISTNISASTTGSMENSYVASMNTSFTGGYIYTWKYGISNNKPSIALQCQNLTTVSDMFTIYSLNQYGFWISGGGFVLECRKRANSSQATFSVKYGTTTIVSHQATISSSSKRYKHNIRPLSSEREPHKLLSLPIVEFEWNDDHVPDYEDMRGQTIPGIIAEDVEEIYPAATIHDAEGRVESWDERRLIPGMLALIQEQDKKIKELEARLAKIEEMLK